MTLAPCGRSHDEGKRCRHCDDRRARGLPPVAEKREPYVHAHCPLCPYCGDVGPELVSHTRGTLLEFQCANVSCLAHWQMEVISPPYGVTLPLARRAPA